MGKNVLTHLIQREIEWVHDFISGWFRGEQSISPNALTEEFMCRFGRDFYNLQPAGVRLDRCALESMFANSHGANPEFYITIHDVEIVWVDNQEQHVLATYVEAQSGARNSAPNNRRFSTAFFKWDDERGGYTWLHLQETALPVEQDKN